MTYMTVFQPSPGVIRQDKIILTEVRFPARIPEFWRWTSEMSWNARYRGVSGLWSITNARHEISGSGFTTSIRTGKPNTWDRPDKRNNAENYVPVHLCQKSYQITSRYSWLRFLTVNSIGLPPQLGSRTAISAISAILPVSTPISRSLRGIPRLSFRSCT